MKTGITIKSVKHAVDYKLEITFSDGKVNVFDYEKLVMREHEEAFPYRSIKEFKKFKIVNNTEIAWGKNWDLILPLKTIYNKNKFSLSGRKTMSDKKELLRIYVNSSVIDANGGVESAQKKCTDFLNKTIKNK